MGLSREARIQRDTIEEETKVRLGDMLLDVERIYVVRANNFRHVALLFVAPGGIVDITGMVARICRLRTTSKRGWIMLPRGWGFEEVVDYMTTKIESGKIDTEVLR